MPRILLSKNRVLDVPLDVATRVEGEWRDQKCKQITIGDATYKRGEIVMVDKGGTNRKAFDLSSTEDYRTIKEFEKFLKGLEEKALPQSPEWYGYILKNNSSIIVNELIGPVHPAVVQWAIDEGAIQRNAKGQWSIVDNSLGGKDVNISRYVEIANKLKALKELRDRKSFAENKNLAQLGAMVDKEGLFNMNEEDMGIPTPEEIDAALN